MNKVYKLYILCFFIFGGVILVLWNGNYFKEGLDTDYKCNELCGLLGQSDYKTCDKFNTRTQCFNNDGKKVDLQCKIGRGKCSM